MSAADLTRAAAMAYRCLIRLQVRDLPVRPEAMLRLCRRTVLMTYAEAAETIHLTDAEFERRCAGVDACTFREDDEAGTAYLVCWRAGGNRARLNFTLAHELGHIVLGHRGNDPGAEAEADCFASHLLCPRPALRLLQAKCGAIYAEQVAELCYVSLSAALMIDQTPQVFVPENLETEVEKLFSASISQASEVQKPPESVHGLDVQSAKRRTI